MMKRDRPGKLIPVRPKNYRRIVLQAIGVAAEPIVFVDGRRVEDFSETGPLTQRRIRRVRDLEVRDGGKPILGFHDHPDQMWISEAFEELAEYCSGRGWLRVEDHAS